MSDAMDELAARRGGYLDHETVCNAAGFGIAVSYWRDYDAALPGSMVEHMDAQRRGRRE